MIATWSFEEFLQNQADVSAWSLEEQQEAYAEYLRIMAESFAE